MSNLLGSMKAKHLTAGHTAQNARVSKRTQTMADSAQTVAVTATATLEALDERERREGMQPQLHN